MSSQPDPPAFGGDELVWFHAVCPGCGCDWWHAADAEDETTAADVDLVRAALGVCGECRASVRRDHTPRPAPRRRRDRRR